MLLSRKILVKIRKMKNKFNDDFVWTPCNLMKNEEAKICNLIYDLDNPIPNTVILSEDEFIKLLKYFWVEEC